MNDSVTSKKVKYVGCVVKKKIILYTTMAEVVTLFLLDSNTLRLLVKLYYKTN